MKNYRVILIEKRDTAFCRINTELILFIFYLGIKILTILIIQLR